MSISSLFMLPVVIHFKLGVKYGEILENLLYGYGISYALCFYPGFIIGVLGFAFMWTNFTYWAFSMFIIPTFILLYIPIIMLGLLILMCC